MAQQSLCTSSARASKSRSPEPGGSWSGRNKKPATHMDPSGVSGVSKSWWRTASAEASKECSPVECEQRVEQVVVEDPVTLSSELRCGDNTLRGRSTGARTADAEASDAASSKRCKCKADWEFGPPSSALVPPLWPLQIAAKLFSSNFQMLLLFNTEAMQGPNVAHFLRNLFKHSISRIDLSGAKGKK